LSVYRIVLTLLLSSSMPCATPVATRMAIWRTKVRPAQATM